MSVSGSASALLVLGDDLDLGDAFGELQRGLERVGEPALDAGAAHEPVDDDLDRVLLVPLELELGRQVDDLAVDPGPRVALARELVEQRVVLALAAPHDRREHLEAGAVGQLQHPVDDLLRRLAGDQLAAVRAVRHADAGVEQPQVVVDLGDRADRRPRVARRRLLVDRDRRRQALDEVDVGLVHLPEELPGVRRQRLDVAALALGVDRVERQRRLARARQPGEHDQLVARQHEVDVAEVVLARPADDDRVAHCASGVAARASRRANICSPASGPLRATHPREHAAPRPTTDTHRARSRTAERHRPERRQELAVRDPAQHLGKHLLVTSR